MGGREEPERIEIELVSADASASSPFRPPSDAAPPASEPRSGGDHRTTIAVAAAVGVVGLFAGWMLGRAGSERGVEVAPVEARITTANGVEAVDPVDEPIEDDERPLEPTSSAAPDERAEPSEVTLPPVRPQLGDATSLVEEIVGVIGPLSGQPIEVVAYGNGGQLTRLDLSTGILRTQEVRRHAFGRPELMIGDTWLLMPAREPGSPSVVVDSDGSTDLVDFGADRRIYGVTDLDLIWLGTSELEAGAGSVVVVDIDASLVESIDLPRTPSRFDPRGGFVVVDSGGSYQVTGEAPTLITPGDLLAIGSETAVARECDLTLTCEVVVIDRSTGSRRSIVPGWASPGEPDLGMIGTASVAPGAQRAIVWVVNANDRSSAQPTLGVLDLVTGLVSELGPAQGIDQSVWTPDGRFVIYNGGGRLLAYDTTNGNEFVLSNSFVAIDAFGIRPPLGEDQF